MFLKIGLFDVPRCWHRSPLQETFTRNVDLKGKRLLNYINTVCVNGSKKFPQALTKLRVMRGELSGCSEDFKEMLLLLLSYFDEKEDECSVTWRTHAWQQKYRSTKFT